MTIKRKAAYKEVNEVLGTNFTKSLSKGDWNQIAFDYPLTEEFMEKYIDRLNIITLSAWQKFSEDFIRKHSNIMDWKSISAGQVLSEDFIEEFKDKLDWYGIIKYQTLSEDFIERLLKSGFLTNKLNEGISDFDKDYILYHIAKNQKMSIEFLKRYGIDHNLFNMAWTYRDADFKKKYIMGGGKFECYEDYFIVYKAVRMGGYPLFSYKFKYEKGGIYESKCDCFPKAPSYGIHAGTISTAKHWRMVVYDMQGTECKILKCKVRYEDAGMYFEKSNFLGGDVSEIRCSKIEVIDYVD